MSTDASSQQAPCQVGTPVKGTKTPLKTTSGGGGRTVRCSCAKSSHLIKEAIARGLSLIRARFNLAVGELPDLRPEQLSQYLLFLLGGRDRRPLPFPRRQTGWSSEGFPILSRLGRSERWMLAQSCASMKRNIPDRPCRAHPPPSSRASWMDNQCPEVPPVSHPDYLRFARKEARRIFQFGWDSTYESFCHSFAPKSSQRADRSNASLSWSKTLRWLKFQSALLGGRLPPLKGFDFRYAEVPTAGKTRPMGIPTQDWDLLGPLHKTMYQHLSTKEWLMVGPPTASRIASVSSHPYLTSVDLVKATDGLRLDVAEAILGVALSKATVVPGPIRHLAALSIRPTMEGIEVTHGQMMGTYLSFPLLCLQSYIAARWATRHQCANYLVNGDDTFISSSLRFVEKGDYPEGTVLNDSKTIRSLNVAELNSTTFLKVGHRWKEVVNLRRGCCPATLDGVRHAAVACRKAGDAWVTAFYKSRLDYRWRLLPDLHGFSRTNKWVFFRQQKLLASGKYYKEDKRIAAEHRYRLVDRREITEDEQIAFRIDLFEKGRETEKRVEYEASIRDVRKKWTKETPAVSRQTFAGKNLECRRAFGMGLSYDPAVERFLEKKGRSVKVEYSCVPLDYEGRETRSSLETDADGERWLPDPTRLW
ncbi:RNA dependent RNA polymerase [Plasmopara viticola lesion associated ourmia-like virus 34]|uniref:RNA dependent RNA polymerase n=1 Tax=Plasmopara viticola lesion associated ourmia-like virus 34 TaxID=2686503 RepID=A0ABX6FJN8_9VIRU|nr:RNA dependent RNA polymerase [Plasmopara viticola lesion associated ourmia-like virus 34]QGY72564.1 RNA dependent RNA polymerase [Plasmopara viticola lesion associated ourmia-like virus 34]